MRKGLPAVTNVANDSRARLIAIIIYSINRCYSKKIAINRGYMSEGQVLGGIS